jgi:hypothetical protein
MDILQFSALIYTYPEYLDLKSLVYLDPPISAKKFVYPENDLTVRPYIRPRLWDYGMYRVSSTVSSQKIFPDDV